jgi:hypothetical protein
MSGPAVSALPVNFQQIEFLHFVFGHAFPLLAEVTPRN